MRRDITIGVDVGTSGCKAAAVRAGRVLCSATAAYPLYTPRPGWSEQEPSDWWDGVCRAVRALLPNVEAGALAGLSLSGQMHGMVALSEANEVVRPAILWNDQRTQTQCDAITESAGGLDKLLALTGNMMLTGYTGGKILWLRDNEPDAFSRTRRIVNPKDYILLRLTGRLCTDVSDASGTGLFDVEHRRWSSALIGRLGLEERLFAEPLESTDVAGHVTRAASLSTGLPEGLPVCAGGGDAVVSAMAMGLDERSLGITLGTSGVAAMRLNSYARNRGGLLQLFCGNLPGSWVMFGCTLNAAGSYQWLHDKLFLDVGMDELNALAAVVPPGSDGLLFTPYLSGERCPVFDAEATGGFYGLRGSMGRGHFVRAMMEGVAFSMRQVYELICAGGGTRPDNALVSGGGSRSALWRQILSDVLGLPVAISEGASEGGAYGAAILAGIGLGLYGPGEACAMMKTVGRTEPIEENLAVYRQRYNTYQRLYEATNWINRE